MNSFISLSFLFFLHYLLFSIHAAPYKASDMIFINCGTPGNFPSHDHDWLGDEQPSKYAPTENNPAASKPVKALPRLFKDPYLTARVSLSDFTYVFPLSSGPKFVRFHFNPTSYQGYNRSSALFSVTVGGFTLLNNFTGSMLSDSLNQKPLDETFFREFCINVDDNQKLEIQFSPSKSVPGSYALINGIEVVSMPTYLYYIPSPEQDKVPRFIGIGSSEIFPITTRSALETVHRLNVGGGSISPADDTGMYRKWFGDDKTYIVGASLGALPLNLSIAIKYSKSTPDYVAPDMVYKTGRSMGMSAKENVKYNLTWMLPVDLGFNYLIRLHFCEFESEVRERNDREFTIFINNMTADAYADVISWTGGNGIPVYKDFVVMMKSEGSKNKNERGYVLVALHPNDPFRTRHQDALLNGLEMFKISDGTDDLAGASSENIIVMESPRPPDSPTPLEKNRPVLAPAIGAGLGGGLAVIMVVVLCMVCYMRRKGGKMDGYYRLGSCCWGSIEKGTKSGRSTLPDRRCRYFTLAEMREATRNFDDNLIIGGGGFGRVYKGFIDGGETIVAIKRLDPKSRQGPKEFITEIETLSQLRHHNLVPLIGYCVDSDTHELMLVYEYMLNGTLCDHLYGKKGYSKLTWKQRLEICMGAARGLEYLHGGATHVIIHRDVKSANILLDSKWAVRVADFGLSKFGPTMDPDNPISTMIKGTRGYLDPEYMKSGRLTTKCDVYSFGVVLLEAISGRRPLEHALDDDKVSLAQWARDCKKRGALHLLIDPYLVDQIAQECLRNFVDLAISCVREKGIERPTMKDVVGKLEFVLQLQVEADAALQSMVFPDGPPSVEVSTGITPADSLGTGFTTTAFGASSTHGLTCQSIDSESMTSSDDDHEGGP
ncbi:Malectin-like domain [Dillenia turbinata]|uniref:Malectin-like domain n=1 Tax=Dillenia turbinata TaxID=194707 RepID=A0AAN8Z7T4_9MAGN